MSYDETLARRIRKQLQSRKDVEEKKMFGGLCFMVSNHMCCGIVNDSLMARVGPDNYDSCLSMKQASEMDFTGKPMKGMVYVAPAGIKTEAQLKKWLTICTDFISTLPPKTSK